MAVRSTQGQNKAVRSTPGGRGVPPSTLPNQLYQLCPPAAPYLEFLVNLADLILPLFGPCLLCGAGVEHTGPYDGPSILCAAPSQVHSRCAPDLQLVKNKIMNE